MDVYIFITDGVFLIILRARLIITKTSLWNTPGNILGRQKADNKTAALLSSCLHWAVFPSQSVLCSGCEHVQTAGRWGALPISLRAGGTNQHQIPLELQPLPYSFTTSCHANSKKQKQILLFFRLPQSATSCKLSLKSSVDLSQPFTLLQPQHCFNKLP